MWAPYSTACPVVVVGDPLGGDDRAATWLLEEPGLGARGGAGPEGLGGRVQVDALAPDQLVEPVPRRGPRRRSPSARAGSWSAWRSARLGAPQPDSRREHRRHPGSTPALGDSSVAATVSKESTSVVGVRPARLGRRTGW